MSILQSSTEITQYNLNEIFHEILHKTPYDPDNPPNEDEEEMDHDGETSDGSGDEDSDDTDYEEFVYPEDNIRDEYGLYLYVFVYVIVYFWIKFCLYLFIFLFPVGDE